MNIGIETLLSAVLIAWLIGYGTGVSFRFVRQIFEKATRG